MKTRVSALGCAIAWGLLTALVSLGQDAVGASAATDVGAGRRLPTWAPEVRLGDRLFFETRFAQYFFAHSRGAVNAPLAVGDPVVAKVLRSEGRDLPGPFRGQAMSCRHCHLGDDYYGSEPSAQRTYCDFSTRTAVPVRNDGVTHTVRNSQQLVDIGLPVEVPRLFHFDGEFASAEDLIVDTLTGRNMGWRLDEHDAAIAHIARVIREDDGVNPRLIRGRDGKGIPYADVFSGSARGLPRSLQIPPEYRLDVKSASDVQVLHAIAKLMHAYMDSIRFGIADTGRPSGSPYDLFLARNHLPAQPEGLESNAAYARRLLASLQDKARLNWVTESDGRFDLHHQPYRFGPTELSGLMIFLQQGESVNGKGHVGTCVSCHVPPQFTDHNFHNTGVAQHEYDLLFGAGAFASLPIPGLAARNRDPDAWLPASLHHPHALNRFRSAPSRAKPGFADLGVWNILANADYPKPQAALLQLLCEGERVASASCTPARVLPSAIARFKTPSLRDLGHSEPYFHSGSAPRIEDALRFYVQVASLARSGRLRNGAPELASMQIGLSDIAPLAAFLRSLNEDYH